CRPGGVHAQSDRGLPRALSRPDRHRAPFAPARVSGRARDRRRARRRRRDDGGHSPLCGRGPRHGCGHPPGARDGRAPQHAARSHPRSRAPHPARGGESALRALISVYDKTGLQEFARGLAELGFQLVASGGTADYLETEVGLDVERVEELTGVAEMLGGRVKTLHPRIHAAILARRDHAEDVATLDEQAIRPFDLVCVNLYPFSEVAGRFGVREEEAVEMIDIGGPSMLRGAAKNFAHVAPVCRPERYESVLAELHDRGDLSAATRRALAAEAFATTAAY